MRLLSLIFLCLICSCSENKRNTVHTKVAENHVVSVSEKSIRNYQKNYSTLNVFGNVKEILCTKYVQFVPSSDLHNFVTKENYKFDKNGNNTHEESYLEDGKYGNLNEYYYDRMNNALLTVAFDEKRKEVYRMKDSLNHKGYRVKQTNSVNLNQQIYEYHFIKQTPSYIEYYTTISSNYNGLRTDFEKWKYSTAERFDDNGNLISSSTITNGEEKIDFINKYDQKGNLVEKVDYRFNAKWTHKYKDRKLIERRYTALDSNNNNEIVYDHDDFGNITKQVTKVNGVLDSKGTFTTQYTYDSKNNWITRTRLKPNGEKISFLERRITYY